MISTEGKFNDLGIDVLTGVQILDWLGLSKIDLGDPSRFSRIQDVVSYLKQFPVDTQRFLVMKATRSKFIPDKLQHVWEYTQLLARRKEYEDTLKGIQTELSALGPAPDPMSLRSVDIRSLELNQNLAKINSEIEIYEK